MDTKVISENPGFLAEKFRTDLMKFESLEQNVIEELIKWIVSVKDLDEFGKDENFTEIARKTHTPLQNIRDCFKPIIYYSSVCANAEMPVKQLLEYFDSIGHFNDAKDKEGFKIRLTYFSEILLDCMVKLYKDINPAVNILTLRSFTPHTIIIPDFGKSFDPDCDSKTDYTPVIHFLHTRIIIDLSFSDDEEKHYPVLVTEKQLDQMIKALELTKIEFALAKKAVKLIDNKEG
jgi:hypothetical protein